MQQITVTMFGNFSLQANGVKISDNDNRSKKVWILLAYLLCKRDHTVSRKDLIRLLWGDSDVNNPENTLKITFYRLRTLLNQLWPSAGHDLILFQEGGYRWNPEIPLQLDTEHFDILYHRKETNEILRLSHLLEIFEIYQGDFLSNLSSESWIIPITTHYHNLYVDSVLEAIPLMVSKERHQDIINLCRKALIIEPYHEALYLHLMRALTELNDQPAAVKVYEELTARLYHDFGIQPNKELRQYYRFITNTLSSQALPLDTVLEDIQEADAKPGALQCDYDFFKVLCHAEARAMLRSGIDTHIALLSIPGQLNEKPLSKRSLEKAMEQLGTEIQMNLRRGDTFSRCSVSQFIVMLPGANYGNSEMVCRRVIGAFFKKHPHSPVKIQFMVYPLSANGLENR